MQQAFEYIRTELNEIYFEPELGSIANLIISEITGYTRVQQLINKNTKISDNQGVLLQSFINELKKHTPIQYVIGHTEFYGLTFKVNPDVLIPRPETEELLEWMQATLQTNTNYNVLDIGTGSGCIAISIKSLFPNANVTAFDISEKALLTAAQNATLNNCDVKFILQDILQAQPTDDTWDVIVSNPPYIPEIEKDTIMPNVLDFEPHGALFVPSEHPLLFYDAIANYALKSLNPGGQLFFEIHRDFGTQIVEILEHKGFRDVVLRKDMSGNDRMIKAILQ